MILFPRRGIGGDDISICLFRSVVDLGSVYINNDEVAFGLGTCHVGAIVGCLGNFSSSHAPSSVTDIENATFFHDFAFENGTRTLVDVMIVLEDGIDSKLLLYFSGVRKRL